MQAHVCAHVRASHPEERRTTAPADYRHRPAQGNAGSPLNTTADGTRRKEWDKKGEGFMREDRGSVANVEANRFNGAPPKADRVNDNLERVRASTFSGSGILWLRYAASTLSVSSRLAKNHFPSTLGQRNDRRYPRLWKKWKTLKSLVKFGGKLPIIKRRRGR